MDLKPNNYQGNAFFGFRGEFRDTEVTFDDFEEWSDFASALPLLHPQHLRLSVTRIRNNNLGLPYPFPLRSYRPESFPRVVRLDNPTLGAFVGGVALKEVSDHPINEYREKVERQWALAAQISKYLGLIPVEEILVEA